MVPAVVSEPERSKTSAAFVTMLPATDPVAPPAPIRSVPAETVVTPLEVLSAERVSVPLPSFVNVFPVPAIAVSKATVWPLVSTLNAWPVAALKRFETSSVFAAVNWSVPPRNSIGPLPPMAPALPSSSVPPWSERPPETSLAPVKASVPAPSLARLAPGLVRLLANSTDWPLVSIE